MKSLPLKRFVDPARPITYGIVQAGEDVSGGVPYIRPVDMDGHSGVREVAELRRTTPEIARQYRRSTVRARDLVVSIGPSYGKTMIVPKELDGANLTQGTARVALQRSVDRRYMAWALQAGLAIDFWNAVVGGATFRALNLEPLARTPIPAWPLEKQQAIASFLDTETARIDALIGKKSQLLAAIKTRYQQQVAERTAATLVAALNTSGEQVPPGWRSMKLRRCLASADYGIGDASKETGEIAVLGMANVNDTGGIDGPAGGFVDSVDPSLLLRPDDLLFNRTNSLAKVGKVGLVRAVSTPTTFASYLVRLRTTSMVLPDYLNYLLNTQEVLGIARASALPSIGQSNLNPSRYSEMWIVLPDGRTQQGCVEELDAQRGRVNSLASCLSRQVGLLKEHRQALITAAVTGQMEVPGVAA